MANIKVSEMPETTAANIDDLIMIIQGGGNKKITEKNLLGDRVVVSPTEPTGNNRKKIWFQKGKNLFNKNNIQSGSELLSTTLYAQPNSDYYISDYIEITPGQTYYLSGNKTRGTTNIFYNENKVPVSSYAAATGTIPIPNSATYIRFNGRLNELDNNIQLEQGSKATTYEAYIRPTIYILNDNNVYEKIIETVDENDFYSVGEQKTNKIWIDGKPIYRKTIVDTTFRTDFYPIANNIEQFVNQYGYVKRKDYPNAGQFINSRAGTNMSIQFLASNIDVGIQIDWGSNWKENYSTLFDKIIITVEYTKK